MSEESDYELEGNEENYTSMYEGDRNDAGGRHGHGKASFPNGDVYEGKYEDGKRNGLGAYKFRNAKYVGEYKNGKRHGDGQMHYPDGSVYSGNWDDGEKSGMGTYTYSNGDVYEGEWKDDQKHGKGVYTYTRTGTQFKGHWIEGVRDGIAEWTNKGFSYKGFFRSDKPFGRGRFVFDNGYEQHGYFMVTNLVEKVGIAIEVVEQGTQWTCTSLIRAPQKFISGGEKK